MSRNSNGDLQVAFHNNLVSRTELSNDKAKRSLYRLSINARRLLLYIIAMGINNHRSNKEIPSYFDIHIQNLAGYMKLKHSELYNQLKESSSQLITTLVEYVDPDDGHLVRTTWLSEAHYWEGEGKIRVGISKALKPVLTDLSKQYTLLDLATCGKISSGYAMRLYELLKSKQNLKYFIISIDELREILSVPEGKFSRFCTFNQKLLKPAIDQLHDRTELKINFTKGNPRGRKWTHLAFEIKTKSKSEMKLAEKVEDIPKQQDLIIPELETLFKKSKSNLEKQSA